MKEVQENRAVLAMIAIMVAFNGLLLSLNGVFMLIAPATWYEFVPGVTDTGFFNQHFIRDIGLIYGLMGIAFLIGAIQAQARVFLWISATAFLVGHALFHFWEVAVGICEPSAIARDFPAVTLPAILGSPVGGKP